MFGTVNGVELSDVSSTLLLMLYGRVLESRSSDPILRDPVGERIVDQINESLRGSDRTLYRQLARFKIKPALQVHAAIRARQYDAYSRDFMREHPGCTVISLGCGLDTRYWRVDDGQVRFFDLDLPEVIQLKRGLLQEEDRYRMVACSVLDHRWLHELVVPDRPTLLLAEGLFMYLQEADVQDLVRAIGEKIAVGQLVAEFVKESYTRGLNQRLVAFKFKHELGFDGGLIYRSGLRTGKDLERWSPRLHHLDDWSYFDSGEKKLGLYRWVGKIASFKWVQWTSRYRIGDEATPSA